MAGLQGQTRLSTLLVTANSLSSTSFTLAPFLPALRKLDGGSNNIDSALNICSKYTTLQELILDHNIITSVDGVEWCTQLLVLDIGSNKYHMIYNNGVLMTYKLDLKLLVRS